MCQESDYCEMEMHPAGMLDRDQRTTPRLISWKTKSLECCENFPSEVSSTNHPSRVVSDNTPPSGYPVSRTQLRPMSSLRVRRKFCGKVKDLCLFFIFVWISLNCLSQVTSKPIRIRRTMITDTKHGNVMEKVRKDVKRSTNDLVDFQKVQDLLKMHKMQVNITYNELSHGITDYISQVFHHTDSLLDFHKIWFWRDLAWLHGGIEMPKKFQENITKEYEQKLRSQDWTKPDKLLSKFEMMYEKYKRLDIGIQTIHYYYKNNAPVQNKLKIIDFIEGVKNASTLILCSLHDLMSALNYDGATFEESNSNPVPDELRSAKEKPDLDNWVILREYMNALELYRVELSIISEQMAGSKERSA